MDTTKWTTLPRLWVAIGLAIAGLALGACGDDGGTDAGGNGDGFEMEITLQEWAVIPDVESAPAGEVTFQIHNIGDETHEFVVIRTDLASTDLPTESDGSVAEAGEGMEVIDEVEDIPAGESAELTATLEAGNYVFICNIVESEDGETESHYQMGMRTSFPVE